MPKSNLLGNKKKKGAIERSVVKKKVVFQSALTMRWREIIPPN